MSLKDKLSALLTKYTWYGVPTPSLTAKDIKVWYISFETISGDPAVIALLWDNKKKEGRWYNPEKDKSQLKDNLVTKLYLKGLVSYLLSQSDFHLISQEDLGDDVTDWTLTTVLTERTIQTFLATGPKRHIN